MDILKTKGTFGEHLKREREMRGVSLEEIATATRISTRFLQALENEQWERLPGGVFNRGFVRAVAHFLGLDEESLLAEYSIVTNDKPQVAVWAEAPPPRPRRGVNVWVLGVAVLLLAGGGWLAYYEAKPLLDAWRHPAPAATPPKAPAAPAASTGSSSNPENSPAAAPVEPAPPLGPGPLELKIEAGRNTTLKVTADGKTLFDGRIEAGEQKRFQANQKFEISAGNSTALLLELNGQTVPPLGPPGEAGSVTLTHKDVKKPTGGQD